MRSFSLTQLADNGKKVYPVHDCAKFSARIALGQIELGSEVETEIRNSVLAGNIATAHQTQLSYMGWVGSGYLLIDPETGAGAYKIAGGMNGGNTQGMLQMLFSGRPGWLSLRTF